MNAVTEFFAAVVAGAFSIALSILVFLTVLALVEHKRQAAHFLIGVAMCALIGYGILFLLETHIGALPWNR